MELNIALLWKEKLINLFLSWHFDKLFISNDF
jgi:hypothetical protein